MPATVITGPPFSGKGQYVRDEIARREDNGELGLVAVDFTAIYAALAWGVQSSYRDEAVSDTGAPRLAGAVYDAALAFVVARELEGFVTTQSPRRAVAIADRLGNAPILTIDTPADQIATRAASHLANLRRLIPRANGDAAGLLRCRAAGATYLLEKSALVGRAREVTRTGKRWKTSTATVRPFDRELFEKGLTARGRSLFAEPTCSGSLSMSD